MLSISYILKKEDKMKLIEETKKDKNLFEALYDAFKWANRANEKLLRVEAIIDGSATVLHYSLEEETAELRRERSPGASVLRTITR